MGEYQLPPSSPLRSGIEVDKTHAYPTPDPSSSIGAISSPVRCWRKDVDFGESCKTNSKDFNVMKPEDSVLKVPLDPSKNRIFIGRSSRSCDYSLRSGDKRISRTHATINYDDNKGKITLCCLGYNGLAVIIPRSCLVYATDRKDEYVLIETCEALEERYLKKLGMKHTTKTIKLGQNHTEFVLNRNETVIVPRVNDIILDFRGQLVLLNPTDDCLTDDETNPLDDEDVNKVNLNASQANKRHQFLPPLSNSKYMGCQFRAKSQPSFEIHEDKSSSDTKFLEPDPLSAKEKNSIITYDAGSVMPLPLKEKHDNKNDLLKRRAASEEPPKSEKKKKTSNIEKIVIDQNCVQDIPNKEEINNILVNHLAFSRLSSTPASNMHNISAKTAVITLNQIRTLLFNLRSVGTIYREGKDAAGKPLEEEYYYMPENDEDPDRPVLVARIKGHGGLRSCRRTHKQYFWKKPAPVKK